MDTPRADRDRRRRLRFVLVGFVSVLIVAIVVLLPVAFPPAAPRVDAGAIWIGRVERGNLLREVGGVGSLVPEEIRWISAQAGGRVEQVFALPGSRVESDDVILDLGNPLLEQEAENARFDWQTAEQDGVTYELQLQEEVLAARANLAELEALYREAELEAETREKLFEEELESELIMKKARLRADQLKIRLDLEQQRAEFRDRALASRLAARRSLTEQARASYESLKARVESLSVRPGFRGVLQRLSVAEGMQVEAGQSLAQVANPEKLKAIIRVSELEAGEVRIDLPARVDTRHGIVQGRVSRVDPNVDRGAVTIDITLTGNLPDGSRPDLTVEAAIQLEELPNVLHITRPAGARPQTETTVFRILDGGRAAERTQVRFGRASARAIEVVSGLDEGDRIVLSDTSAWNNHSSLRIR